MSRTNKIFLCVIALIVVLVFTFAGCQSAKRSESSYDSSDLIAGDSGPSDSSSTYDANGVISGRKVIYNAYATIWADSSREALDKVKGLLKEDEWIDSENNSSSHGTIVVRIKSSRLTEFLQNLSTAGSVGDYTIKSQDVTKSYTTIEEEIAKNETLKAKIEALIPSATTLDEVIKLEKALADIESELTYLNNKKNTYDSQIEYSTVTIYVNQNYYTEDPSFGDTTKNAISDSWKAFGNFFVYIFWGIIYVFPFLLLGGVITFIVVICIRKKKGLPLFKRVKKEKTIAPKKEEEVEEKKEVVEEKIEKPKAKKEKAEANKGE